jgi:NAD+ synthase (glutamine-hydrolysing)
VIQWPVPTTQHGFIRVAAASPRVSIADPERNLTGILDAHREASAAGAQILVLPELAITGYTAGDLFFAASTLVAGAEEALRRLLAETASSRMLLVVGLPVASDGRLFNCAAVLQGDRLLGLVPKTFLPNYREFYERRWFASARDLVRDEIDIAGQSVPFGTDLLFAISYEPRVVVGVEICEDLWAPSPPSSAQAVAGATIVLNPSASNDVVAKADYRRQLVTQQSARTVGGYVLASCGAGESSTDLVFGGHTLIAENGVVLAEGPRFQRRGSLVVSEIDVDRLTVERLRMGVFGEAASDLRRAFRGVPVDPIPAAEPPRLIRPIDPHPFVPSEAATLDARCEEIFSIQTSGLASRLEHVGVRKAVIGLSGGLDSTLALLVAVRTFDLLDWPRRDVQAVTMPGFGTSEHTLSNARRLAECFGASLREIDIREACTVHLRDIGIASDDTSSITFQNAQARERTQVLMDLANRDGGLVVGTGDLSELALGWCTFAGDHMAMYNVNGSVPKTLVRLLVRWVAEHRASDAEREVLLSVIDTPVSPELTPPAADGSITQRTEELIGPYELHDFFLHHHFRGAGPRKILFLAEHAFEGAYPRVTLVQWLRLFLERFFAQQFKRSCLPDGPKVGAVSLSPRGDWRMPSDASPAAWLKELEE